MRKFQRDRKADIVLRKQRRRAFSVVLFFAVVAVVILLCIKFSDIERAIELRAYPHSYSSSINKYALYYHIDENLIYAIARTESGFNPEAESNAGARGLMQMTEETFDWVKRRLGAVNDTFDDLYDSDTNIKYCAYYISYLRKVFGNDVCAVAAYHAGLTSVNTWLKDERYSDDGDNLKLIPSDTTSHYVDKVMNAYERYNKIYG